MITPAEKSALWTIHIHGYLSPSTYAGTSYGPAGDCCGNPDPDKGIGSVTPVEVVRRCSSGWEVVMVPSMQVLAGPFTRAEAENEAAVRRMARKAERLDRKVIMAMARRAEEE